MNKNVIFFGNIYINNEESFLRMKDSFNSFNNFLFSEIIINIRGSFKIKASEFFLSKGVSKIYNIESSFGWFHDSYSLLRHSSQEYIFMWLEDFICLTSNEFEEYINVIIKNKVDIARYTFKQDIIDNFSAKDVIFEDSVSLSINAKQSTFADTSVFIISYASLIKKDLLYKILLSKEKSIWNIKTPFGFEKNSRQIHWLPLKMSFLKREIIASIDDDHDVDGSSLQSRGLYPIRTEARKNSKHLTEYLNAGKRYLIKSYIKKARVFWLVFFALITNKISFRLFIKLLCNLNYLNLNSYSLRFLNQFNDIENDKILLITLNNELEELRDIFKNKEIKLITNLIYHSNHNKEISLKPIPFNLEVKSDEGIYFEGYSIKVDLDLSQLIGRQVVIKRLIYNAMNADSKSKLKKVDLVFFD